MTVTLQTMFYRFLSGFVSTLLSGAITLQSSGLAQSATPNQFRDITDDIYANEIEQAVALGIVTGFEDRTFRPQTPVTREQLVSMVIRAISDVPLENTYQATKPTLPAIPNTALCWACSCSSCWRSRYGSLEWSVPFQWSTGKGLWFHRSRWFSTRCLALHSGGAGGR